MLLGAEISCQVQSCAEEVSFTLDLVRMYKGAPVCEVCYETRFCKDTDQLANVEEDWDQLPEVNPFPNHHG